MGITIDAAIVTQIAFDMSLPFGETLGAITKSPFTPVSWPKHQPKSVGIMQFEVGGTYDNGQGVPQDYKQAYAWYSIAAANGHTTVHFYRLLLPALDGRKPVS